MKRRFALSLGLLCCLVFSAQAFAIEYGNARAGGQTFQSRGCVNCHGQGGHSTSPMFPILAGQYQDYIVQALKSYKDGKRQNPIMSGQASGLSDSDIWNISAYLSQQSSTLKAVGNP